MGKSGLPFFTNPKLETILILQSLHFADLAKYSVFHAYWCVEKK